MNRYEFESLISEYLDGSMPFKKRIEFEDYIKNNPDAESLAQKVVANGLSARQAEALVKNSINEGGPEAKAPRKEKKSADIKALEQRAARELGLAISIDWDMQTETGRVQINCQSLEQMTNILEKLGLSD